jgi:hypothetical protein
MNVPAPDPMDMSIEFVSSYLYHSTEQVSDTDLERQLLLLAGAGRRRSIHGRRCTQRLGTYRVDRADRFRRDATPTR